MLKLVDIILIYRFISYAIGAGLYNLISFLRVHGQDDCLLAFNYYFYTSPLYISAVLLYWYWVIVADKVVADSKF